MPNYPDYYDYPLPKDILDIIDVNKRNNNFALMEKNDNFGLLFQRMLCYARTFQNGQNRQFWQLEGNSKAKLWEEIKKSADRIFDNSEMKSLLSGLHKRFDTTKTSYYNLGFKTAKLRLKVEWRLVIGFGLQNALETGITLHRLYGFPYLPGSSIKGNLRHFWLTKIAQELGIVALEAKEIDPKNQNKVHPSSTPLAILEELLTSEKPSKELVPLFEKLRKVSKFLLEEEIKNPIKNKLTSLDDESKIQEVIKKLRSDNNDFRKTFGSTDKQGEVIFFDAFPEARNDNKPILELDIINTHYQKYYMDKNKNTPPADYLSPVPIQFLAISAGTIFKFRLVAKDETLLNTVKSRLKDAVAENGIGAKTMAGYGEMLEVQ